MVTGVDLKYKQLRTAGHEEARLAFCLFSVLLINCSQKHLLVGWGPALWAVVWIRC